MRALKLKHSGETSLKRDERKMTIRIILLFVLFDLVLIAATQAQSTEMTLVKGGAYKMGNTFEEIFEDELPVHGVTLQDFYIGTYEVTQAEWKAVMGANPSQFKGDDNRPVETISWLDAVSFCNKLSAKENLTPCYSISRSNVTLNKDANGYRLPTEAEWEFAARGGTLSKNFIYAGSNNLPDVGWFKDNSAGTTHPVGTKQPNELGIYDMSGNVWEWIWDWYSNAYSPDAATNPLGNATGCEKGRRGGSWHIVAKSCRNSNRLGTPSNLSFNYVGLRLARNAK